MQMELPTFGFGTYRITDNVCNPKDVVANALKAGYRAIDTANLYNNEEYVGAAIKESGIDRKDLFLTTKVSRKHLKTGKIEEGVKMSFSKLGVDYIDLILLHFPHEDNWLTNWEKLVGIYNKYNGKIRYIGVSNYSSDQIVKLIETTGHVPYCNQIELSPFFQRYSLVETCKKNNIKVVAYCSLTRNERTDDEKLVEIANKYNHDTHLMLLAWALKKGYVVIPKAISPDHQTHNLAALDLDLSDDAMVELDTLHDGYCIHKSYKYEEDQ